MSLSLSAEVWAHTMAQMQQVSQVQDSNRLVLFNGLELNDEPPGYSVTRYHHFQSGAWLTARILVYCYTSFPPLWVPAQTTPEPTPAMAAAAMSNPNNPSLAYRWRSWVEQLETMDKQVGSWAVVAERLSESGTTHEQVRDIARAVIELAVRDAEIERNAYREHPIPIPPFQTTQTTQTSTPTPLAPPTRTRQNINAHEQNLMARIRSATAYEPRVGRVEKCIYRALALKNVLLIHAVAANAPQDSSVHQVIQEGGF